MKIAFVWQGFSGVYGRWNDGLRGAMDIIAKNHEVKYYEPWEEIKDADIILYWESPVTGQGSNREHYEKVRKNPLPKIMLFAGGPIKKEQCVGFDLFLVESKINEEEFSAIGLPWLRAFGVNTDIMKQEQQPKMFDACFPSTCAGWKRQGLFARALGGKGIICGRGQAADQSGFLLARQHGTFLMPEISYEAVNAVYNASWSCVNTSDHWGGGQRTTLEAMACGVPVIVMKDSIKNREYVEESGAGLVVDPDENAIRKAIEEVKAWTPAQREKGIAYVQSKWTHKHYAENIIKGINLVLKNGNI